MEIPGGRRIVVWGTGFWSEIITCGLERETQGIEFFIDSNPEKQSAGFHGRMVAQPETLNGRTDVFVIIAVEDDKVIADALSGMGKKEGADYQRFSKKYALAQWENVQPKKTEWIGGEDIFEAPDYFYSVASPEEVADRLMADAFALSGLREREGLVAAMKDPEKPGTVCPVFYYGRSGSFFAASFFSGNQHPQVLSVPDNAFVQFERFIHSWHFSSLPGRSLEKREQLFSWCLDVIKRTFYYCEVKADTVSVIYDSEFAMFKSNMERKFKVSVVLLFLAQMLLMDAKFLNYETLLKSMFLAVRGAQAKALASQGSIAYVWGTHWYLSRPGTDRRLWMSRAFKDAKILTMVRFPEKTIDSHFLGYMHKKVPQDIPFDNFGSASFAARLSPEMASRDCFRCARFEDLHEKTGMVLAAWCKWLGVEYSEYLSTNSYSLKSSNGGVNQGARRMKTEDLTPYSFSFADILKLRYLFQEEYRAWGYDEYTSPSLDESIALYKRLDRIAALPFAVQGVFDLYETGEPSVTVAHQKKRHERLLTFFREERERRDKNGFTPIPLLYPLRKNEER